MNECACENTRCNCHAPHTADSYRVGFVVVENEGLTANREVMAMKYIARFRGRELGAIGIFYRIVTTVEADNPEAARLKVFEQWDLAGPSFLEILPADEDHERYAV